jgi:HEAT repeat protein
VSKLSTLLLALLSAVAPSANAQTVSVPVVSIGPISLTGVDAAVRVAQRLRIGDLGGGARHGERLVPPAPWSTRDPADSLYRLARRAMADENYRRAAEAFADLVDRYPRSDYAGDALYYRAYCLYQLGGLRDLRDAADAIDQQARDYPEASTRDDARTLRTRIEGAQARHGDADAAKRVQEKASQLGQERGCPKDDDDPRIYALQALMQMDAESAIPILRQVLAKRDSCSESLRKQAVFIVSQKRSDEATNLLLQVARADPSPEVRADAIQWLGQARSPRAAAALDSIAANATDDDVLDKAIFALSQTRDERSDAALRRIAADEHKSTHARTQAIFWFGQTHRDADDMRFLRELFGRTRSEEIQGSIIQAMSQAHTPEAMRWLIEIARDKSISIEARKNALFWAGQSGADVRQLVDLYDEMKGQSDIQNQLIFVFSQRRDREAVDKLMDIAKNDSDRDLRKQAIFWLGQSRDPRVQQFILDLINR